MANAKVKMADGALITIEGSPIEVAEILAKIHGVAQSVGPKGTRSIRNDVKRQEKKQRTASDLVAALKEEAFFDKPKRLSDVGHKLEEGGFMYPVTTLSGVMLSLVQKKILSRKKLEGVWVYGKR